MTRASIPDIPPEALRNHASAERVERVWRRIELDVATTTARSVSWWWAPVAAVGIFGLGVVVGTRWSRPTADVTAAAEPRAAAPTPGAAPVIEPVSSAEQPQEAPAQKRPRARRVTRADRGGGEAYTPTYDEPSISLDATPAAAAPGEWEKLAESGDFRAAQAALDREGGFDHAAARASAGQLLLLADVARASGHRDEATRALRRVLSSYLSAPEAPIAAWTLGNLLEQAGDRSGAAEAYAAYRRLSPAGDFAEDAAARQVDVALSQGNLELGRRAMEEYAQNFPTGRRLAELRKRLAALESPVANGSGSAAVEPDDNGADDDAAEPGASAPSAAPVPTSR
jgi:hypothetical protein